MWRDTRIVSQRGQVPTPLPVQDGSALRAALARRGYRAALELFEDGSRVVWRSLQRVEYPVAHFERSLESCLFAAVLAV